jgi:uncharacterized membrane protein YqjE
MKPEDDEQAHQGLLTNAKQMASNVLGLLLARTSLAALELAEARDALFRLLLLSACGLLAAGFALVFWSALLVYLSWHVMGWTILLVLAMLYSILAWILMRRARQLIVQNRLSLPATMAELRQDYAALLD